MFLKSFTCKIVASSNKITFRKLNKDYNHGLYVPGGLTTNRHYSITNSNSVRGVGLNTDHDTKFEQITLLSIKKTIKGSGNQSVDGFCCIRTECPVCDLPTATIKNLQPTKSNVYVNKTTGKHIFFS